MSDIRNLVKFYSHENIELNFKIHLKMPKKKIRANKCVFLVSLRRLEYVLILCLPIACNTSLLHLLYLQYFSTNLLKNALNFTKNVSIQIFRVLFVRLSWQRKSITPNLA